MPSTKQELHTQWFAKYVTSGLISQQVFTELLEWDIDLAELWYQWSHLKENLIQDYANLLIESQIDLFNRIIWEHSLLRTLSRKKS